MQFIIPGSCVPKARPRTTFRSGKPITYTPAPSREYASKARLIALNEYNKKNRAPIPYPNPVRVRFDFVLNRSSTARPDIANLVVQLLDVLQGVSYSDDSQVVELQAVKRKGKYPMVKVSVEEL